MTGWLERIAAKIEPVAIPHLIRVIVGFNALVFVLYKINPDYLGFLELDRGAVLRGEVWRLVTYLFIPQLGGIFPDWFSAIIYLYFLLFIGDGIEAAWGAARMNLYYFFGMFGTTVAALVFGGSFSNAILNTSLFFAFASLFPDTVIYLFFVLPVRVKWLAWITGAMMLLGFATGPWAYRAALLASLGNFLLFFGPRMVREARTRADTDRRKKRFERDQVREEAFHRCATCGRTDHDSPELEFRVAADGHEYCLDHLPSRNGR